MRSKRIIIEAAHEPVAQPTADVFSLRNQGQQAQSGLDKFARDLAREIEGDFSMGPLKELGRIFQKAAIKYEGDATRVHDIARGTCDVDSTSKIEAARRILNPERQSPFLAKWAERGYYIRDYEDKFASPSQAGFRSLDLKIEVPFSNGGHHICELQIHHTAMKDAYSRTHQEMEVQRKSDIDPNAKDVPIELAVNFAAVTDKRREIHDAAAIESGLTALEKPRSSYAPQLVALAV